jgi:hypothetical protein
MLRLLLNVIYYFGVIGVFVSWAFEKNASDWQWWVQVFIFALLINLHRDIDRKINKH